MKQKQTIFWSFPHVGRGLSMHLHQLLKFKKKKMKNPQDKTIMGELPGERVVICVKASEGCSMFVCCHGRPIPCGQAAARCASITEMWQDYLPHLFGYKGGFYSP